MNPNDPVVITRQEYNRALVLLHDPVSMELDMRAGDPVGERVIQQLDKLIDVCRLVSTVRPVARLDDLMDTMMDIDVELDHLDYETPYSKLQIVAAVQIRAWELFIATLPHLPIRTPWDGYRIADNV